MGKSQYEVIFQFKAAMDASMGSIRNVSTDLERVRDRANELQAALGQAENLKAYQQSLEEARIRLNALTEAEREATAALGPVTQARMDAQLEVNRHQEAVQRLSREIEAEQDAMRREIAALRDEGASREQIAAASKRHIDRITELKEARRQEKEALEQSKKALQDAKNAETEAQNAKKNATNAVREAKAAYAEELQKLNEATEALKRMGVDTEQLDQEIRRLNGELKDANQELGTMQEREEALAASQERMHSLANGIRAVSMAFEGLSSVARPVWNFFTGSLSSAAGLEKQVSAIRAISGATEAETEAITRQIRETGATTVYTAEEAAGAMQTMALAGWDAQQMIAGLPGVVHLAAAAGEDLADMTGIVTDGMNAFQMSGVAGATKFADVLARAATSSNTNVAMMGDALSYVETTAGNLGYSVEDVAVALAAMANNSLKAGVAGSALNTSLTRMSGANANAAGAMEEMGLSMYDVNGQAKPLLQFLNELRGAFRDFGDDAQAAQIAAYRLAGQRGMRGLLAIVNQSDEQWERLTQEIYNYAGAAQQISEMRLDNYAGQLQLLSDAWTDLKITIGNQVLPVATELLKTATGLVSKAGEAAEGAQTLILWAGSTAGAVLGLNAVLKTLATTAQGVVMIMRLMEQAGHALTFAQLAGALGKLALAGVAIGGIVTAIIGLTEKTREQQRAMEELAGASLGAQEALAKADAELATNRRRTEAAAQVARRYIYRLRELEPEVRESADAAREYHETLVKLSETTPELAGYIDLETDSIQGGTEALLQGVEAWERLSKQQAYQTYYNEAGERYNAVLQEQANIEIRLAMAEQRRRDARKALFDANSEYAAAQARYQSWVDSVGDNASVEERILKAAELGLTAAGEHLLAARAGIQDADAEIAQYSDALTVAEGASEASRKAMDDIRRAAAGLGYTIGETGDDVGDFLDALDDATGGDGLMEVMAATEDGLNAVAAAYEAVCQAAEESYSKQFALWETLDPKAKTSMNDLMAALESQTAFWSGYSGNLNAVQQAAESLGLDLSGIWPELTSGSKEAAAAVAGMADALSKGDTESFRAYVEEYDAMVQARQEAAEAAAAGSKAVADTVERETARIKKAVAGSDSSYQARRAMEATVQAFYTGLSGMPGVEDYVRQYAKRLNNIFGSIGLRPNGSGAGPQESPLEGEAATGTSSARSGVYLVGERGPELVVMQGGERVIPAGETRALLGRNETLSPLAVAMPERSGRGGGDSFTVNITVQGSASEQTVRDLRSYGKELEAAFRRMLREEQTNAQRRAYV